MISYVLFLFAFLFSNRYVESTIYDCSSNISVVNLQLNALAFFYSNSDPILEETFFHCDITFILNDTVNKNIRGLIVYRYFDWFNHFMPMIFTFSNSSKISTIQPVPPNTKVWFIEGHVIFEDQDFNCPLESVSRIKPYKFTNDLEIVHLINSYNGRNTVMRECNWRFVAPIGYGFKVIVTKMDISENTRFRVENETDILLNENSIKVNHPLYNGDTYIQIYLSNTQPNLHFQAYVSIVRTKALVKPAPCHFISVPGHLVVFEWYTFNKDHGAGFYRNNQECTMTMIIKPGYEYWVNFVAFALGDIEADYVEYSDGEEIARIEYDKANSSVYAGNGYYSNADFMLLPFKNNTERNVTWKFVSDGSNPGIGFDIFFHPTICQCTHEIPCKHENIWAMNNTDLYCSNMECEVEILECKENNYTFFSMTIIDTLTIADDDYFQVFSNNALVYELRYSYITQPTSFVILKSSNKNVLKFKTFYAERMRSITFSSYGFDAPPISKRVILSSDNPLYVVDSLVHQLVQIEISNDQEQYNYTTQIYRMYFGGFTLYNNESLTHEIQAICGDDIKTHLLYKCKISNIKKFVIFWNPNVVAKETYPYAVVQLLNRKKQCVFNNMLYYPHPSRLDNTVYDNYAVSDIASPNESCVVTVLLDPGENVQSSLPGYIPQITKVFTTSRVDTVKIFTGTIPQPFFEFNSTTQDYWKDILLNTIICTIEIPKNSSALVYISNTVNIFNGWYYPFPSNVTQYPYFSVMSTAWRVPLEIYQSYFSAKYPLKFTVKYWNMPDKYVWLEVGSTEYRFNKTNDYFVFQNQVVTFSYDQSFQLFENPNYGIGAIILIEALNTTDFIN